MWSATAKPAAPASVQSAMAPQPTAAPSSVGSQQLAKENADLRVELERLRAEVARLDRSYLEREIADLVRERDALRAEIVETRDLHLLQEAGLYRYAHPLDSSVAYAQSLEQLRARMDEAVRAGTAVLRAKTWLVNGSLKEGERLVTETTKLVLRAYNNEADAIVRSMKPYTVASAVARLEKTRAMIAKFGKPMSIAIADAFHALRVDELTFTADYLVKLAEEKERQREERARLREEEIARREYEREQARLEKERSHYLTAFNALTARGDLAGVAEVEQKLADVDAAIEGVARRAANARAGFVYVISNIGAFGTQVVKIGLTRRLDPMDRVRELGDASVPFRFDVHAIIFSDDAVGLETALHHRFADRRVNLVNSHREFFYVEPHHVKGALAELNGNLLSFDETPEAIEWRQSESARGR